MKASFPAKVLPKLLFIVIAILVMANTYKTPGVYVEEISFSQQTIQQEATAIPAFIGCTQIAKERKDGDLLGVPRRITSLQEYERFFGKSEPESGLTVIVEDQMNQAGKVIKRKAVGEITSPSPHNMHYAIRGFFANGGRSCFIVPTGTMGEAPAIQLKDLIAGVEAVRKVDEVTLLVVPESIHLDPSSYASLVTAALDQCASLGDRFVIIDILSPSAGRSILDAVASFRALNLGVTNLKYGAAYTPQLETIFNYAYSEDKVSVLRSVNGSDPETDGWMSDYAPKGASADKEQYALMNNALSQVSVVLPPSPFIAGVYATVDATAGIWKAPANVSLNAVVKPAIEVSNAENSDFNVHPSGKSINAIRTFQGKGTVVWGARTLAGNDNNWRYVSVRRLFNMVEESVKKSTEPFVFEPNNTNTWRNIESMIDTYLVNLWRQGALLGATSSDAFYVKVGLGETMTANDILEGRMIVEMGMAVVRPAEFIILKFEYKMAD